MPKLPRDQRSIDRLPTPEEKPVEYASDRVKGLRLEIRPNGARRYRLKFRVGTGRTGRSFKTWTLGDATQIAIGRAEIEARERLATIVLKGEDPRPTLQVTEPISVDDLVRLWVERHGRQHKRSWERDLDMHDRLIAPRLGSLQAKIATRQDILAALDDIAVKTGPVQANRVQAVISACFSWALDEGLVDAHPAYRLRKRGKETVRDRHLSAEELRRFWVALDYLPNHIADALKLLALTGQRRSEVGGMMLHELDMGETPIWTLPEDRVKNKLIHAVPLTPEAVEIVRRNILLANGPFLFPARLVQPKPIEGSTLSARFCDLMRELEIEGARLHDLRHTVKTGLAQIGVPDNISDRVTNQVTGQRSRVGSRYDHHTYLDEKRRALNLWEQRLLEIVEGRPATGLRW